MAGSGDMAEAADSAEMLAMGRLVLAAEEADSAETAAMEAAVWARSAAEAVASLQMVEMLEKQVQHREAAEVLESPEVQLGAQQTKLQLVMAVQAVTVPFSLFTERRM